MMDNDFKAYKDDIILLLANAGLPTSDIDWKNIHFETEYLNDVLIACGAIEIYGEYGLLRSLAVREEHRGKGVGEKVTRNVLEIAQKREIKKIYLLTTDAEEFFKKLGFVSILKTEAPTAIHKLPQFQDICPDSAVCMVLSIGQPFQIS